MAIDVAIFLKTVLAILIVSEKNANEDWQPEYLFLFLKRRKKATSDKKSDEPNPLLVYTVKCCVHGKIVPDTKISGLLDTAASECFMDTEITRQLK